MATTPRPPKRKNLTMSILTQQVTAPPVCDPNSVPETFVNGPISMQSMGAFATLTFTSVRPTDASGSITKGPPQMNVGVHQPIEPEIKAKKGTSIFWVGMDLVAALFWLYAIVKVFVF